MLRENDPEQPPLEETQEQSPLEEHPEPPPPPPPPNAEPPGQLPCYVFSPDVKLYSDAWKTLMCILVFYSTWAAFFEFGFLKKPSSTLSTVDMIVDILYFGNIVLTFLVAYREEDTNLFVYHPFRRKKLFWVFLAFDIVSIIPFEITSMIDLHPFNSYGMLYMLRLWRLVKVKRLFERLEENKTVNLFFRCVKLMLVTFFVVHVAACVFYYIATRNPNPSDTWIGSDNQNFAHRRVWDNYVESMYWSITTFSTVGFGDLHPSTQSKTEMIFTAIYMLINFVLSLYLLESASRLVFHDKGEGGTMELRDKIGMASSLSEEIRLPIPLRRDMIRYFRSNFVEDLEKVKTQEVIDSLPKGIRSRIALHRFGRCIKESYLFQRVSDSLVFQLASEMKIEYFCPYADIILRDERPTDFYIFVTGRGLLIEKNEDQEVVAGEYQAGELCGVIEFFCYKPQLCTVRTSTSSQLLRFDRSNFLSILKGNTADGQIILENLIKHLEETVHNEEALRAIMDMVAGGMIDLPLDHRFAITGGHDFLLLKLLKQYHDPNQTDMDGSTLLHLSATLGHVEQVKFLLEYKADPNRRDSSGTEPLWRAIDSRHYDVARVLYDGGARLSPNLWYPCNAVWHRRLDVLKSMVLYGGNVIITEDNKASALHIAIHTENLKMIQFLVNQGADLDAVDENGVTPRMMAMDKGIRLVKYQLS